MWGGRSIRVWWALGIVAGGALAAWLLARDAGTALLVAVLGTAAVLLAASVGEPAPARRDPDEGAVDSALDQALDAIGEPVVIVTASTVARANRAARALLGEHIPGEDVRLAIRHPAAAERLLRTEPDDRPVELVGLGARDQHWQMRVAPLGNGRNLIHLVDRTDARAADRIRVDFVANASHELRTPLASILGFIETLREGAGDEPAIRDRFLGVMDDEARRMERLVGDLMSLSRIEAEKYRLPDALVDLGDLARKVCDELSNGAPERGRDLTLDVEGELLVQGDAAQLSQLLHNLAGNAMKYGRPGTPVTIAAARAGELIRLAVSDRGDGIPPEHLPRLTERFYRVDPGRSRAVGGTGLGLAICKHIVERHRGRLAIASTVGEGTTVTVLLPAAMSSSRNETATQP